ncbi:maleylpyruvate isomerase family mycothiol-dependent enzyme [Streptomyces sp. TLI_105]|uniref:maleylpyruvate isomerase family mycothiol-dependent enzyme n=1 Tax=Streptomyces sp. TLI_105 TaxID=1881019 RepID=UPI0008982E89|nr:maleylpyruvate isomerase family mycothiol-dependent enzyme [Streptomyces sp. TLI_105]SEE07672.1 TIGR03083 family protein [Streptomyces sp. TLI_105]
MEPSSLLRHLRRELDAFRDCLDGDPATPIRHCGDWTLLDLAEHLGGSNLRAAAAVTEQRGDHVPAPAPRERAALVRWFDDASQALYTALDTDPSAPARTFHPPHTVGFWQRRRCVEALVHRWDAEHALGVTRPLDAVLAGEAVAEVFDTTAPRQIARGRVQPPRAALRLEATDTGTSWTYGPGAPVAVPTAPAESLLLLLWGRIPLDGGAWSWGGDEQAGRRILEGPLTP